MIYFNWIPQVTNENVLLDMAVNERAQFRTKKKFYILFLWLKGKPVYSYLGTESINDMAESSISTHSDSIQQYLCGYKAESCTLTERLVGSTGLMGASERRLSIPAWPTACHRRDNSKLMQFSQKAECIPHVFSGNPTHQGPRVLWM